MHFLETMSEKPKITRSQLHAEHATLSFLAWACYRKLFGRNLKIEHSLADGYWCADGSHTPITAKQCEDLTKEMNARLDSDTQFELVDLPREAIIQVCAAAEMNDKIAVLKTWQADLIPCIRYGDLVDYCVEPMSTDKERVRIFNIHTFADGLVLRYPIASNPYVLQDWEDPQVLHDMFREYERWANLIGVHDVHTLNEMIYKKKINNVKWVAEGLHDQKFTEIAERLCQTFDKKRIVTIAGPSSSNKTTFAKRLAIQLRVNGYNSLVLEMDDFFKDNVEIPFGPDGLQDFEDIFALNVDLLAERVEKLLKGEVVPRRRFIFKRGEGEDFPNEPLQMKDHSFLILEGIHGLNPVLLDKFGRDRVTPIYVSCLTPINIDSNHRFPTSDLRLIRRMVRDYRYRGHSPRKTLMRWNSVRLGEERNIFPYQANAELAFNSALVYEISVLTIYAKSLLSEATMPDEDEDPDSQQAKEITAQALRLQGLLKYFYPLSTEIVPHISCIREFVGGSDLKY